ncbi:MAG: MBL fold metallo-hydrolase RNA specificity domain-containing protein [Caulobacteraceae bacterium]
MRLSFLGAAETVTGSCYLLNFDNMKVLVDCGMYQGGSEADDLNFEEFRFNPAEIDYLLLTHAHIDHSGRIPQLVKRGFKGKIITSRPTCELCKIMLPDSAHIQEMETEWQNRKRQRAGKPPVEALYTLKDASDSLNFFKPVDYNEIVGLSPSVRIRFRDAGHILGSSSIEMWVNENSKEFKVVFSGDLGNINIPIMKDPTVIEDADYVIVESTYGNRLHKDTQNKALVLLDIINDTVEKGGNVVIPSFAIERTQEILYMLNMLKEAKFSKLRDIPVYVDSPLAINATKIFEDFSSYLDEEAQSFISAGDDPFSFPNLFFTQTADESKAINTSEGSSIILSASGMCEAGRIKHHLKHNLWRKESSIVFVGYQAKNTLGRKILDGEKNVKIFGEDISVNCSIYSIDGFSGHADQKGLMNWLSSFTKKPAKIFLTHGEDDALTEFSKLITEELGIENEIARLGQNVELTAGFHTVIPIERYMSHKQSISSTIADVKASFGNTIDSLQSYMNSNDNIKLNKLSYMLEKLEDVISDINNEIKKDSK